MSEDLKKFTKYIFSKYSFEDDDINNVKHYLDVNEYEIALESLVLSCIQKKIPLNLEELDIFKKYIKDFKLGEHSVYVLDAQDLFYKTYNL